MAKHETVYLDEWSIPAAAESIWGVLADPANLPKWWRGVYLESEPLDDETEPRVGRRYRARARGFLPFSHRFSIRVADLVRPRTIAFDLTGGIASTWRADLHEGDAATRAYFESRVQRNRWFQRLVDPLLAPLFAASHRRLMAKGQTGLIGFLAEQGKLLPPPRPALGPGGSVRRGASLAAFGALALLGLVAIIRPR